MTYIINRIAFIISLIVIIAMLFSFKYIVGMIDIFGSGLTLGEIFAYMAELTLEEQVAMIAILGSSLLTAFGFPVTIFLISLNGLKK